VNGYQFDAFQPLSIPSVSERQTILSKVERNLREDLIRGIHGREPNMDEARKMTKLPGPYPRPITRPDCVKICSSGNWTFTGKRRTWPSSHSLGVKLDGERTMILGTTHGVFIVNSSLVFTSLPSQSPFSEIFCGDGITVLDGEMIFPHFETVQPRRKYFVVFDSPVINGLRISTMKYDMRHHHIRKMVVRLRGLSYNMDIRVRPTYAADINSVLWLQKQIYKVKHPSDDQDCNQTKMSSSSSSNSSSLSSSSSRGEGSTKDGKNVPSQPEYLYLWNEQGWDTVWLPVDGLMLQRFSDPYGSQVLKAKFEGGDTCDLAVALSHPSQVLENPSPKQKCELTLYASCNGGKTRFSTTECKQSELPAWGIKVPVENEKKEVDLPVSELLFQDHQWVFKRRRLDKKGRPNSVDTCVGTLEVVIGRQAVRDGKSDEPPLLQILTLFDPVAAGRCVFFKGLS